MNNPKILIVCGPTASGKTRLALSLASQFNGEVISADSRHVYVGMDIVTGKDIPPGFVKKTSSIIWRSQFLSYFTDNTTRLWLTDLVNPDSDFSVSAWRDVTGTVISDILSRGKLPIVVGGTGLYLKSLVSNLSTISVPQNSRLRAKLQKLSVVELFTCLQRLDAAKANSLNTSDRANPRRLLRAIEIASFLSPSQKIEEGVGSEDVVPYDTLQIGLKAKLEILQSKIATRIQERIQMGALAEVKRLAAQYPFTLSSMTACGYAAFQQSDWETAWLTSEKQYLKKQLTWFKKQPNINWFDITQPGWESAVSHAIHSWYNKIIA